MAVPKNKVWNGHMVTTRALNTLKKLKITEVEQIKDWTWGDLIIVRDAGLDTVCEILSIGYGIPITPDRSAYMQARWAILREYVMKSDRPPAGLFAFDLDNMITHLADAAKKETP